MFESTEVTVQSADTLTNKITQDERKILSRLVLQKAMASDANRWIAPESYDKLSRQLLSETPEDDVALVYKTLSNRQSYYSTIATVNLKWTQNASEINDLDGNVWTTFALTVQPSISNGYTSDVKGFVERAECLAAMKDLINEIVEMVPGPIRVMTLDNDARVARDNKRKYDTACEKLSSRLRFSRKELRSQLRRGGKGRAVRRDDELLAEIAPGRYEVRLDDGSRRRPNVKVYQVTVPDNTNYLALVKRIA